MVVVVMGRGVEEGPELGPHRQGDNKGCSRQEQYCKRSVPFGTLNAKNGKNLDFLPRVLGGTQSMGLGRVWTAYGQVGRVSGQTNDRLRGESLYPPGVYTYNL